jgi:hypothetical protein
MKISADKIQIETIAAKIYALGELIKFRGGEPSLDEERVNFGIGEILTALANALVSERPNES